MWKSARGFLGRLRRNVAGNTLAMAAAALLPLIGAVGGAVDISRYYMANARLQAACDAGALAARKKMGDNTWEEADRLHGLTFFDQNYADGTFGLENLSRNYTADSDGTVTGTASGNLPTTLMQIFNFGQLDLSVTCSAEINISNTDIMFVLDVTGSMNCTSTDTSCSNNGNVEATGSKIDGLRDAVMTFYDTVDDATSDSAQVRYGIVPYSNAINVGASIPTTYMADSHTYQTRVPQWTTTYEEEEVSFTIDSVYNRESDEYWYYWWNPSGEYGVSSYSACEAIANSSSLGFEDDYIDGSLQDSTVTVVSETWSGTTRTRVITARGRFTKAVPVPWYSSWYSPPCFVDLEYYRYYAYFQATVVDEVTSTQEFDNWVYQEASWDISDVYTNNTVVLPTGDQGANETHSWSGCIEEADTVNSSTWDPVPTGAYDLDINLVPSTDAEKWKPYLPSLVWKRETSSGNTLSDLTQDWDESHPYSICPKAAQKLTTMTRTEMETYISESNGFTAEGSTYHDIGMIWGARFISPRGIFASENATAPNGDAIGRHIVFMTDGLLSVNTETYTPYGIEWWDRRISTDGGWTNTTNNHAARFQAACKAARNENISVWVVAFGTTLTQNLIDCATSGRAFTASDSAALDTTFQEIAERIAALRLTQ